MRCSLERQGTLLSSALMSLLSAALLCTLFGATLATSTGLRSQARSQTQLLRRDLKVWLQKGGATRLEEEEKFGEQLVDKSGDSSAQEDDTNEKIIEALLVKQKRLEGENKGLRKQLQEAQSCRKSTSAANSADADASQEVLRQLWAERNKTALLQDQAAKKEEAIRNLRQSLNKAKKALLQSVDGEAAESNAVKDTQSQALMDAQTQNAKLAKKLHEVEGRRQALQGAVSHLQGALNMSLIAVSQAEHLVSKDESETKDPSLSAAKREIEQLRSENRKLKVAGHTLMEKFDQLRRAGR